MSTDDPDDTRGKLFPVGNYLGEILTRKRSQQDEKVMEKFRELVNHVIFEDGKESKPLRRNTTLIDHEGKVRKDLAAANGDVIGEDLQIYLESAAEKLKGVTSTEIAKGRTLKQMACNYFDTNLVRPAIMEQLRKDKEALEKHAVGLDVDRMELALQQIFKADKAHDEARGRKPDGK